MIGVSEKINPGLSVFALLNSCKIKFLYSLSLVKLQILALMDLEQIVKNIVALNAILIGAIIKNSSIRKPSISTRTYTSRRCLIIRSGLEYGAV